MVVLLRNLSEIHIEPRDFSRGEAWKILLHGPLKRGRSYAEGGSRGLEGSWERSTTGMAGRPASTETNDRSSGNSIDESTVSWGTSTFVGDGICFL